MFVSRITLYPFKALDGITVERANVTTKGALENDRRWALIDNRDSFLNGKNNNDVFALRAGFNLAQEKILIEGIEYDINDIQTLNDALSQTLGRQVRVVENAHSGFPDDTQAYGPTIISEATLIEVASWFPELGMNEIRRRFRANIEIQGVAPFWEDTLCDGATRLNIGETEFEITNPCARCSVPTKDSKTGRKTDDFYARFMENRARTLPSGYNGIKYPDLYRLGVNTKINFSNNRRTLHVADSINVLE